MVDYGLGQFVARYRTPHDNLLTLPFRCGFLRVSSGGYFDFFNVPTVGVRTVPVCLVDRGLLS